MCAGLALTHHPHLAPASGSPAAGNRHGAESRGRGGQGGGTCTGGCRSHPPCQEVEKCHPTEPTPNGQARGYSQERKAPVGAVVLAAVMGTRRVRRRPPFPAGWVVTEHCCAPGAGLSQCFACLHDLIGLYSSPGGCNVTEPASQMRNLRLRESGVTCLRPHSPCV